jgi:hypothetical protein
MFQDESDQNNIFSREEAIIQVSIQRHFMKVLTIKPKIQPANVKRLSYSSFLDVHTWNDMNEPSIFNEKASSYARGLFTL